MLGSGYRAPGGVAMYPEWARKTFEAGGTCRFES